MLDGQATGSPAALDDIAFMAQDAPVYKNLSVADMLHLTRNLNRRFDGAVARARLADLGIPLKKKSGKLSGGQQAQVALTLALARRPRLLILDEPLSALDPLARQDFMATVMTAMADDGVSVLLSSHALAELERVADYLIVLGGGELRIVGRGRRPARGPPGADRPGRRRRPLRERAIGGAGQAGRGAGPLAGQPSGGRPSGAARLGSAPGQPGRARAGLPARSAGRGAAAAGECQVTLEPTEVAR